MISRTRRAGIQIALFEIEVPGAVLLGHQAPLQTVGEAADDALQARQLLVQKGPQPFELGFVAQFLGADGLVERAVEDLVVDLQRRIVHLLARLSRFARRLGVLAVVVDRIVGGDFRTFGFRRLLVLAFVLRFLRLGFLGAAVLFRAAFLRIAGLVVALFLVVVVFLRFVFVAELFGHLQRDEHVAHGPCESVLVVQRLRQPLEFRPGLVLDEVAPDVDERLGAGRNAPAGQLLAHHQRDGVLQRRLGLVGDVREVGAEILVLQHRAEIVADAGHGVGADRLAAGLLDGVVDRPRALAFG